MTYICLFIQYQEEKQQLQELLKLPFSGHATSTGLCFWLLNLVVLQVWPQVATQVWTGRWWTPQCHPSQSPTPFVNQHCEVCRWAQHCRMGRKHEQGNRSTQTMGYTEKKGCCSTSQADFLCTDIRSTSHGY